MDKYKRLISNTFIFAIGTFSSKLLVFLLMPLYTRVLNNSQYGVVDLLMQTGNLLLPLVSVGINNAIIRFGLDKSSDNKEVFTGGLATLLVGFGLFIVAYPLLKMGLALSGSQLIVDNISLIYIFVIMSTTRSLFSNFVRSQQKVRLFAIDGVLSTGYTIGFNVLFLVIFKWGITGYMLAIVCADGLSSLFLFFTARLYTYIRIPKLRWATLKPMLAYCIPMIPTTIFWWITNVSDRYIVTAMKGEAANGLYAVSYKIPTAIILVSGIFIDAWQMSAISEGQSNTRARFFTKVFASYQSLIFVAGSALILLTKIVTRVLVSDSFYASWQYVPFLIMATSFSCLVTFCGSVYMVEKKSMLLLTTTLAGAVINIILNFTLIPLIGVNGAAFATFISYALVFFLRAVNTRHYIPVNWNTPRLTLNTVIMLAQCFILIASPKYWIIYESVLFILMVIINLQGLLSTLNRLLGRKNKRRHKHLAED